MAIHTIETRAFGESVHIDKLLLAVGACSSRAEARRLIKQGAVEIDGEKASNVATIWDGSILHVGKRFWCRLQLPHKELTLEKQGNQVRVLAIKPLI